MSDIMQNTENDPDISIVHVILIYGLFLIPIALCVFLCWAVFELQKIQVTQTFKVYPDARMLFETSYYYGGSTYINRVFYWTDDSLEDVIAYYSGIYPPFAAASRDDQWLITGFNLDGSEREVDLPSRIVRHGDFCQYNQRGNCITLSIIVLDAFDPFRLMPPVGTTTHENVLEKLNSIPLHGILIIYTYNTYSIS